MGRGYDRGITKVVEKVDHLTEKQLKTTQGIRVTLLTEIEAARSEISNLKDSIKVFREESDDLKKMHRQAEEEYHLIITDLCNRKVALGKQIDKLVQIIRDKQEEANQIKIDYKVEKEELKKHSDKNVGILNEIDDRMVQLNISIAESKEQKQQATDDIEKASVKKKDTVEHKLRFDKEILETRKSIKEEEERLETLKKETEEAQRILDQKRSALISEEAKLDQKKTDIADLERREREVEEQRIAQKKKQDDLDEQTEFQRVKNLNLQGREFVIKGKEKLLRDTFRDKIKEEEGGGE